ncbi:MAG: V-type ATP synthase subunit D [Kiritimatiellae bacterium]|nr:V-type ATP synthase subunit D [Kiritimatiellia bacterium]
MVKVKLTKTELKARTDALKRFQRFLPMLQLKKQQLQSEIAGIAAKEEETSARERELRDGLARWVGLFATDESLVEGLVRVKKVNFGTANIAGVSIPTFESIETDVKPVDPWETPAWVDDAAAAAEKALSLGCERAVYAEQRRRVEEELRQTSQRVNLFEKVKIPECKEAIRVIKIALGDEQTAAVTRGKIAKSRTPDAASGGDQVASAGGDAA